MVVLDCIINYNAHPMPCNLYRPVLGSAWHLVTSRCLLQYCFTNASYAADYYSSTIAYIDLAPHASLSHCRPSAIIIYISTCRHLIAYAHKEGGALSTATQRFNMQPQKRF